MKSSVFLTLLTGLILALGVSGCLEIPTPNALVVTVNTPNATAQQTLTPRPSATPRKTAQVLPSVLRVHDADGIVIDWLEQGQIVTIVICKDNNFCEIEKPFGYVWRGCLSDNSDLGCKEK